MPKGKPHFDRKCEELALHFLQDYTPYKTELVAEFATRIQECVEDFIEEKELET